MHIGLALNDLLDYTDWERRKWFERLRERGGAVLSVNAGPHGDGRFQSVGELMRHIFSAEKRYIERLSDRPITDTAAVAADDLDAIFELSQRSRRELRKFIETFPAGEWDAPREFQLMNSFLTASPRKIVAHVLFHEIRHWAQIATLLRLSGEKVDFHDFLFSPVMGGEFSRGPRTA